MSERSKMVQQLLQAMKALVTIGVGLHGEPGLSARPGAHA
jgi:hypothetical protein